MIYAFQASPHAQTTPDDKNHRTGGRILIEGDVDLL
jgi:hypothetical protein